MGREAYIIVDVLTTDVHQGSREVSVRHLKGKIGQPDILSAILLTLVCVKTHHKAAPKLSLKPAKPPQLAVFVSNITNSLPAFCTMTESAR